jgi:hypothetical protein
LDDEEGSMRLPRLGVVLTSLGLAANTTGRLTVVVVGAAVSTNCECSIGPISPDTLPDGQVGVAYFFQLDAHFGDSCWKGLLPFRLVEGSLPPGMKLSEGGAIDGRPLQAGTYSFTVTIFSQSDSGSDLSPVTGSKHYTLTILP